MMKSQSLLIICVIIWGSNLYARSSETASVARNAEKSGVVQKTISFPGKRSTWNGYDRYDFKYDTRRCIVVVPGVAAEHRPWIWRARFFGHQPQADLVLLEKGFHLVYMDVADMFGSPVAVKHWNAFYELLTEKYRLNSRVALEGMSRGGLIIYNWASANPDKVACIYGDNPVCDFKSWPAGKGKGKFHAPSWRACLKAYGFTEEQALEYKKNPIDVLKPLARAVVPVLHVCGMADTVVPVAENTDIIEKRYKKLGGKIEVIRKPGMNHHPHSLKDPSPIVDFVLTYTASDYDKFHGVLRRGLKNSQIKFERDKKGRVAFLGGSITYNSGWRPYICKYLRQRFPSTKFEFIAAGIPSTGSVPGAFRLTRDVFKNGPVDLLFEEAAVNDNCNYRTESEQLRGMEGIVRHARKLNPDIDIVLMHFADPDKMEDYNAGKIPVVIVNHEKVASYYQTPSLNLALEVTERINAGQFDWKHDFRNLHPSRFGQNVYFRSMKRLMDAAWCEPLTAADQTKAMPMPSEPLDKFSYFRGRYVAVKDAETIKGFTLYPKWKPKLKAGTRAGFVNVPVLTAEERNAELRFKFTGTAVGIFNAAGPDSGIIEYSVDGGEWRERDLFTKWSAGLYLPRAVILESELSDGSHTLMLRTTGRKNPGSKGYACHIVYFLVN